MPIHPDQEPDSQSMDQFVGGTCNVIARVSADQLMKCFECRAIVAHETGSDTDLRIPESFIDEQDL